MASEKSLTTYHLPLTNLFYSSRMGVDEINRGLFVAVLDDFVEGEMKSPLFGGGAKCTAFSSVVACFGLSSRAFTRSAPIHQSNLTTLTNVYAVIASAAALSTKVNSCILSV